MWSLTSRSSRERLELSASSCYVGLLELYGLAVAAASGERRWSPSCGPGLAESYEAIVPDPAAKRFEEALKEVMR